MALHEFLSPDWSAKIGFQFHLETFKDELRGIFLAHGKRYVHVYAEVIDRNKQVCFKHVELPTTLLRSAAVEQLRSQGDSAQTQQHDATSSDAGFYL